MKNKVIKIAITGGPSSGKTTLLNLLKQVYPDEYFLDEVATKLINKGIDPRKNRIKFQQSVFDTQYMIEKKLERKAKDGDVIFIDRTLADGVVYFKNRSEFLRSITNFTPGKYDLVIALSPPPIHGYTTVNNKARYEDAKEAIVLGLKTIENAKYWYGDKVKVIDDDVFEDKIRKALLVIKKVIKKKGGKY